MPQGIQRKPPIPLRRIISEQDRDQADADRADEMNRRFEDVVLNERAEEKFL